MELFSEDLIYFAHEQSKDKLTIYSLRLRFIEDSALIDTGANSLSHLLCTHSQNGHMYLTRHKDQSER